MQATEKIGLTYENLAHRTLLKVVDFVQSSFFGNMKTQLLKLPVALQICTVHCNKLCFNQLTVINEYTPYREVAEFYV